MTDVLAEFRRWVFNEVGVTEEGAWTQEFDRLLRAALVRTPETPEQSLKWFGEPRYSVSDLQRAYAEGFAAPPEGLRAPYGGHPEFGPRVMANQAQPSIAGWESLAKDALLAFDQARALRAAPTPPEGLREALEFVLRATHPIGGRFGNMPESSVIAVYERVVAALDAASPAPDPGAGLRAVDAIQMPRWINKPSYVHGWNVAMDQVRAALPPSAEPPETET